jgi:protein TonB
MMRDSFKLVSGGIAIGIYLLLAGTVLYYFNYRSSSDKAVHYVKKSSDAIAVSLAGAKTPSRKKEGKKKRQVQKPKHTPKKVRNITAPNRAAQKSKRAKKQAKKIKTKSLFSSVKTPSKPAKKTTKKASKKAEKSASQRVTDSLKKPNNSDKGIENRYLASVEQKLRGWPEQANFAGEQIAVLLTVYGSGRFEFKIKHLSANSEFNEALIAYLKQLQSIGLGRHTHPKAYEIEVEFEATE